MFFKKTAENLNKTVKNVNEVIKEVGKSSTKLLNNSNGAVTDFSNKTNAVIWTIVGCIAVTTVTNLVLLGLSLRMGHGMKTASAVTHDTIRIVIGGK